MQKSDQNVTTKSMVQKKLTRDIISLVKSMIIYLCMHRKPNTGMVVSATQAEICVVSVDSCMCLK